jgi:3-oxocholest-4-en-26-oate---CoA ligase
MDFNLADLFESVADAVPDRVALVFGERHLTYRQLDGRATRLAHGLARLGMRSGDHVGLYLHNGPEFIEAMLACYKVRAVPFNINYRYEAAELAYVVADAGAVALVFDADLDNRVAGLSVPGIVVGGVSANAIDYEDVVSAGSEVRDFGPRSGDDHYLLYTGGTTGMPKGVVWRHEDIFFVTLGGGNPGGPPIGDPAEIARTVLKNTAQRIGPFLAEGHDGPEEFVSLALGPLMHASGQWSALGTLLGGGRVVLYPERTMDMGRVLELVEREAVTMLTLVGDTSGRPLLAELRAHPLARDTSSLLLLGSGGSILSSATKAGLLAALPSVLAITEAIGSSEAPVQAVSTLRRDGHPAPTLRFAGRETTAVFDDRMQPVAPGSGRPGRLATRGYVPLKYHNDPARTAATFVDVDGVRWSLPGDMATVDGDGTIRLLGRGSMCINSGGEKVYPEEVEAVLTDSAAVVDAVVVGVGDERWGERVVAVVEAVGRLSLEDLQEHCRGRLAGYKVPKGLVLVDEVRRSPAGKPDYTWARDVAARVGRLGE